MLPPNTAPPGRSVWKAVDRKAFENSLDRLQNTNFVPEPQRLQQENWPKPHGNEVFPFAIEKQLSDDIAFVSAYEYGVSYVTAAAVEAAERGGLLVRLAANEGISTSVVDAWTRLFSTLEKCAEKSLCREQCVEEALNIVLTLNKNRILGRLGSRHFRRPQHEVGLARNALSERLKAYIKSSKCQTAKIQELQRQVNAFHTAFLDVESSVADIGTISRVVMEAFRLTVDGISLPVRLEKAGLSPSKTDTREVREISKIANYWRICCGLAHLSRSYRSLFSKIKLETIEPFARSVWHGGKKRYVHAEIQILVYYERRNPPIWPRVIGASKEACFLCDSFIKAHGLFCVSKAHRQIYSQWTIPDLADYSVEALDRLRRTLVAVNLDVASALKQAKYRGSSRPFPLQSSINLHNPRLPTPSVTTIRSSPLEETDIANETATSTLQHLAPASIESELLKFSRLSLSHHSSLLSASAVSMSNPPKGFTGNSSEESNLSEDLRVQVDPKFLGSLSPGWLDLYASLERSRGNDVATRTYSTASVSQKYLSSSTVAGEKPCHFLDLDTLAPGEEIVLPNSTAGSEDISASTEMSIVLTYPRMNPIMLKCSWHGTAKSRV